MTMDYTWQDNEYHSLQQCFFCRKRPAVTHDSEELFRVIRNTTGFPGYVVNYAKAQVPIPACSKCSAVHHTQDTQLGALKIVAWAVTTGALCYWTYDPADGLTICLIVSALIAIPLSFVPLYVMAIIIALFSKTDQVTSGTDYPVIKKLISMGWQWKVPKAKYGKRKNEDIDQGAIAVLNLDYQLEAKRVIGEFQNWCQTRESQNIPLHGTRGEARP